MNPNNKFGKISLYPTKLNQILTNPKNVKIKIKLFIGISLEGHYLIDNFEL